jgi:hypothetical protein
MATIQDGDLIYIRSVVGLPYEFLLGDAGSGTLTLTDVIGDPNTQWIARLLANGAWTLECQDSNGLLRNLDSDAALQVSMDDNPVDPSTHWDLIQTTTPGRWQIQSRSYGHFLNGGEAAPTVTSDGATDNAHWQLLLIAL